MPRKTKLTPEIQQKIVEAIRQGSYFSVACRLNGVPESTGKEWLARGRGTSSNRPQNKLYAAFASEVDIAEAQAESDAIRRILAGTERSQVIKTKRRLDENGNMVPVEIITEETSNPSNDMWYLKCKYPERWGNQRMDFMDAIVILIRLEVAPPQVLEVAKNGMDDVREHLRRSFEAIIENNQD
ncbi:hypothetical protein WA1_51610 [Scytonema hofmannii PCC 7110]|uniref:Uncharacterized protein n=1 Tax=Scytonema hofmannii PCC 7110 TaxID=128403 RepID=A0A139WPY0_9CYAN|nr:hypothetical protein [Scytonema hofmannii]KYC34492.1 hypothetical protein WA1_51610 [Scytonema hofmannii PCC 7110]